MVYYLLSIEIVTIEHRQQAKKVVKRFCGHVHYAVYVLGIYLATKTLLGAMHLNRYYIPIYSEETSLRGRRW